MTELPFDPYESTPAPSRRTGSSRTSQGGDELLWVMRTHLKAWFFGWLFYCFGLTLLLAVTIHAVTDFEGGDTFAVGLIGTCAWIGGPRAAPSRAEKRAAALGPRYSIGKVLLGAGLIVGAATPFLFYFLESHFGGESAVSTLAFLAGQGVAAGCIFLGRRFLRGAERPVAESPPSQHS